MTKADWLTIASLTITVLVVLIPAISNRKKTAAEAIKAEAEAEEINAGGEKTPYELMRDYAMTQKKDKEDTDTKFKTLLSDFEVLRQEFSTIKEEKEKLARATQAKDAIIEEQGKVIEEQGKQITQLKSDLSDVQTKLADYEKKQTPEHFAEVIHKVADVVKDQQIIPPQ